jgi:hypothetical protein
LVVLVLVLTTPAAARAAITLDATPMAPRFGKQVTFSGTTTPHEAVQLFRNGTLVRGASVIADGSGDFGFVLIAKRPGTYKARTSSQTSAPVTISIRPVISRRVTGLHYPGNRLLLRGHLKPRVAGSLALRVGTQRRHVRVGRYGRYHVLLPTNRIGKRTATLILHPNTGYRAAEVRRVYSVYAPYLAPGSSGVAVLALERRLAALHHVLRGVGRYYGTDTYEAVLAFQKVHGMARTGHVTSQVWAVLGRAHVPRARVASGDHVEVSKTLQVLYEVRQGKVARIVHVSTGATGNTPVGKWRVYGKVPGLNSHGMYYSLFFTGAFAIHGYASVPAWPASHGCVRTPMWFAPGFYGRWGIGSTVYVFA